MPRSEFGFTISSEAISRGLGLATVLTLAAAFRFILLADIPRVITDDEDMFARYYWSRVAMNNVDAILLAAWSLAAYARVLDTRRYSDALLVGVVTGLGWHTYHGTKLHLPLLMCGLVWWRPFQRRDARLALVAAIGFAAVVGPLVPDNAAHWSQWVIDNTNRVSSTWDALAAARAGDWSTVRAFTWTHGISTYAMMLHEPPYGAVILPAMQIPCWCGLGLALRRVRDPRYAMLLIWLLDGEVGNRLDSRCRHPCGGSRTHMGHAPWIPRRTRA